MFRAQLLDLGFPAFIICLSKLRLQGDQRHCLFIIMVTGRHFWYPRIKPESFWISLFCFMSIDLLLYYHCFWNFWLHLSFCGPHRPKAIKNNDWNCQSIIISGRYPRSPRLNFLKFIENLNQYSGIRDLYLRHCGFTFSPFLLKSFWKPFGSFVYLISEKERMRCRGFTLNQTISHYVRVIFKI